MTTELSLFVNHLLCFFTTPFQQNFSVVSPRPLSCWEHVVSVEETGERRQRLNGTHKKGTINMNYVMVTNNREAFRDRFIVILLPAGTNFVFTVSYSLGFP